MSHLYAASHLICPWRLPEWLVDINLVSLCKQREPESGNIELSQERNRVKAPSYARCIKSCIWNIFPIVMRKKERKKGKKETSRGAITKWWADLWCTKAGNARLGGNVSLADQPANSIIDAFVVSATTMSHRICHQNSNLVHQNAPNLIPFKTDN